MPTTSNMSLLLPIPTITPGPTYASENNDAFEVVDAHDHTTGKGVPVPSNGININNDLPYNGFNAGSLRSTQFDIQIIPLALPTDINSLYVVSGNLWYNNGIGQQVQLTSGASLNASSIGGIGGDYVGSGALEFYTSADKTFTFWSSTNTPANLDAGSITIRPVLTGANGITINAPLSLAANYSMTLPGALPGANSFLSLDNSGNITATIPTSKGITNSNITDQTITQGLLAPRSTGTTVGVGGVAASLSSGSFTCNNVTAVTNLSVTITTTGRPVMVFLQAFPDGNQSFIQISSSTGLATIAVLSTRIFNGATSIYDSKIFTTFYPGGSDSLAAQLAAGIPASSVSTIDMSVNGVPGTYTYAVQADPEADVGLAVGNYQNCQLIAYEI